MGFFKKIFNIGKSEANAMVEKLEDPVKMTNQGILDLKVALEETKNSTRQVKAQELKEQARADQYKKDADEWKNKAKALLKKGEKDLAVTALNKHENLNKEAVKAQASADAIQNTVDKLSKKEKTIREAIKEAEEGLVSLKARQTSADALNKANSHMDGENVDSTMAMLNKMKSKVEDTEALNEAHDALEESSQTDEDRIASLLSEDSDTDNDALLASLEAEMAEESK